MMGKLQVWSGGGHHRRDGPKVGGFVSIADLDSKEKPPSPSKSVRKKTPRLSLGRRSFSLRPTHSEDDPFVSRSPQPAQDVSIFSNIPARGPIVNEAFIERPPSSSSFLRPTATPPRPSTADPELSFSRRRSKTVPIQPSQPPQPLPWEDKPLPLAVNFEHRRKRSVSSQLSVPEEKAAFGEALSRPKTTTGTEVRHTTAGSQQRTGSITSASPVRKYSLTPAIVPTPTESRRPSISLVDSRRGSRARSNSTSSTNGIPGRQRSNSQRSVQVQTTRVTNPDPVDVEGTLSATITELQELQTPWQMEPYNPKTITGASRTPLPEMPQSAPAHQGYFMPRHSTHPPSVVARTLPDYSHSLPPTPMMAVTPREDSPSHDQFRSLQASYEQLKRNMQAVNYENDNLKRELSFARKRMEETDALRKERDTLDQSLKDVQTNIDAALDRVRVSRNNEQAALNKATAMAARLDEANMQKVDVLENHLELQQQMSAMEKKIAELKGTVKTLDARPEQSMLDEVEATLRKSEERNKFLMEQVHAIAGRTDLPNVVADLAFKLEDMQKTLKEKEYRIEELEEQNNAKNNVMTELEQQRAESIDMTKRLDLLNASHHRLVADQEKSVAKVHDLEHRVTEKEQSNRILQAERDQFRQLLYADLRRSANEVHNRKHPNTNMLDRKMNLEAAIDEVRARAQHYMDKQTDLHLLGAKVANPAQRARELEEEVEYHVKDIVLYKLDVKGYKKDLKRAQAKIQQLTEQNPHSKASSFSIREGRPSVSSQSSTSTVPQVTFGGDGEPTTLRIAEIRTNGLGAQAYTPSGSPMGSPGISPSKEKRFFSEI